MRNIATMAAAIAAFGFFSTASADSDSIIERLNGTMTAESTHCTRDCDNDPLNGDNPILHQECLDECKENNRASAGANETMRAGADRSLGIGGDTDWIEHDNAPIQTAQPTGHGGVFGGPKAEWIEHEGTMMAESTHCTRDCDNDPLNGDNPILHQECLDECKENNRANADGKIMLAEGGCYINDQGEEICYGEDGSRIGSAPVNTMHASSIRLGDPQPICGTDAWACFNGMDDESPLVRDVGIFGVFSQTARVYCKNGSTNCTSPGQNPK